MFCKYTNMVDVSSSNFVIEINVLFLFGKMLSVKYVPHFPTSPMLENYNYTCGNIFDCYFGGVRKEI